MFSNGQAANLDDVDGEKDVTFRLEAEITPEFKVGAFTSAMNFSYGHSGKYGLNLKYSNEVWAVKAEGVAQSAQGGTFHSNGFMTDVAYRFNQIQPVARFEFYPLS